MTTATATKKKTGKVADVETLRKQLAEAESKRDELSREHHRIRQLVDPHVHGTGENSTRPERLRARARWPAVTEQLLEAEAAVEDLTAELPAAQDAERQRQREAFRDRKAPLVQKLAAQLESAAETNEKLMTMEDEEHCATGGVRALLAWPELMPRSESLASRLGVWLDHVRDEGLLPAVEVEDDEKD